MQVTFRSAESDKQYTLTLLRSGGTVGGDYKAAVVGMCKKGTQEAENLCAERDTLLYANTVLKSSVVGLEKDLKQCQNELEDKMEAAAKIEAGVLAYMRARVAALAREFCVCVHTPANVFVCE